MYNNLNLPICPKCNGTAHVKEITCVKLTMNAVTHKCERCKISWDGYKFEREVK